MKIFYGSDMRFAATFTNEATGAAITAGTMTADLYDDRSGVQLGTQLSGAHVANGEWAFTIPDDHPNVVLGQSVRIVVVFDGGAGLRSRKVYLAQVVEDEAW